MEYGFFYVSNHGVDRGLTERVFAESRRFFQQPMEEKMALRKNSSHRGYFAPYSEKSHAHPNSRGSLSIRSGSTSTPEVQRMPWQRRLNNIAEEIISIGNETTMLSPITQPSS
jgi:isopenicillin N synthase-like dioxygenase